MCRFFAEVDRLCCRSFVCSTQIELFPREAKTKIKFKRRTGTTFVLLKAERGARGRRGARDLSGESPYHEDT